MKILLACLMCLVLMASQCFAISGGPVFGGAQLTVTGSYAGVFVPRLIPPLVSATNSLALSRWLFHASSRIRHFWLFFGMVFLILEQFKDQLIPTQGI